MVLPILQMRKPRLQELFLARILTILQPPAWAGESLSTRSADSQGSFSGGHVLLSHSGNTSVCSQADNQAG